MAETEHAMIARLLAPLSEGLQGAFSLTDDAAALAPPEGCEFVVTMDTLIDGVHFLFDGSPQSAGRAARKALAVNVSDLSAKAAKPYAYLLSLALPNGHQTWLDGFVAGLNDAQNEFGLKLAGGDTVRSPGPLTVTVTAMGVVPIGGMPKRSGARPGDVLLVSGSIGDAWLGLVLDQGEPQAAAWSDHIDGTAAESLLARSRTPSPRVPLVQALRAYATASLDVSDGLAVDASRLAAASGVGIEIDAPSVPLSEPAAALVAALAVRLEDLITGGDDYEVLITLSPKSKTAFIEAAHRSGVPVTEIGRIVTEPGLRIAGAEGTLMQLDSLGWDHFA